MIESAMQEMRRSASERARERQRLCGALAAERGWIFTKRSFTVGALQRGGCSRRDDPRYGFPWIDHADYFRMPQRPYPAAAIVSHTYLPLDQFLPWAEEQRLQVEVLPRSWYNRNRATAALLTPWRAQVLQLDDFR